MGLLINIREQTFGSQTWESYPLALEYEMTLEELITAKVKSRLKQEQKSAEAEVSKESQVTADRSALRRFRNTISVKSLLPDEAVAAAMEAFGQNGFFVIVDGRQRQALGEKLRLTADSKIEFIKLVQLIGG